MLILRFSIFLLIWFLASFFGAPPAYAFCFEQAGARHHVSPQILYLIAKKESGLRVGITYNRNRTFDIHPMGINSVHLPGLARSGLGVQQLLEPCQNVEAGAARLERMEQRYGNTWAAIGAYHSETPALRNSYALGICRLYVREYPGLARMTTLLPGCI